MHENFAGKNVDTFVCDPCKQKGFRYAKEHVVDHHRKTIYQEWRERNEG